MSTEKKSIVFPILDVFDVFHAKKIEENIMGKLSEQKRVIVWDFDLRILDDISMEAKLDYRKHQLVTARLPLMKYHFLDTSDETKKCKKCRSITQKLMIDTLMEELQLNIFEKRELEPPQKTTLLIISDNFG